MPRQAQQPQHLDSPATGRRACLDRCCEERSGRDPDEEQGSRCGDQRGGVVRVGLEKDPAISTGGQAETADRQSCTSGAEVAALGWRRVGEEF